MKTVLLYGELGRRFGKRHQFSVKNAAEALRALKANFKGFESYMSGAHQHNTGFRVFVGNSQIEKYRDIHLPSGEKETIRIVPTVMGSGAWARILIGAVLIAAAIVIEVFAPEASDGAVALGAAGLGLIIGGVSQLLTTPPKDQNSGSADRNTSYVFNGPLNTSAQGAAVPVGYGRMIVGSKVISAGIETHEE